MKCPKCGHEQEATDKCAGCGVYFSKLAAEVATPKSRRADKLRGETPEPRIGIGAIGIAAFIVALLVFGFMRKGNEPVASSNEKTVTTRRIIWTDIPPDAAASTRNASNPTPAGAAPQAGGPASTEKPLEIARNATVLVETGLGVGSGFIIDGQCNVVTNRHVVDLNGARVADEVVRTPEAQAAIVEARRELQQRIQLSESRLRSIRNQPATNVEQAALELRIVEMRKQLEDPSLGLRGYVANSVDKADRAGFTATLADGSRYEALNARFSDEYDLALFKLPAKFCSPIKVGRSQDLAYGQRLYTIGNPSGMSFTLTSGVFSGERRDGQERYLQTDAPINPGNSGGPLLTEEGRVVGINSRVLRDTQGIGFALPIEAVFDAFPELDGVRPSAAD
jgi:serine protease Do